MTVVLLILILLALVFGIGAVLEGLFWLLLISAALIIAAVWFAWARFFRAPNRAR